MKLGLDKMSTGFKIVMGGLLLLVFFFVGYAIYDQIGTRSNYKVVQSEEKDAGTQRERSLEDLIEESKAAKLREEKKKEKALDELIKENKKIDFSKHARSRNSKNQKSQNHDISEKMNWDVYTFEELENQALKTLADNGITCFDFYFVTENGLKLIDKYDGIYSNMENTNMFMLGEKYKEKNGVVNIYADFIPIDLEEKLTPEKRLEEMAGVMGIVAVITSHTSWNSEKLYFRNMNEEIIYWITTKDCRIAYKMNNDYERGEYILENIHEAK